MPPHRSKSIRRRRRLTFELRSGSRETGNGLLIVAGGQMADGRRMSEVGSGGVRLRAGQLLLVVEWPAGRSAA